MNNLQEILLFPVRDDHARKQFLLACLAALAGFVIPIVPFVLLAGYSAIVMRQIMDERKPPSMPEWQGRDWSAMLLDGLRLYGIQFVLTLPLLLLMGFGIFFLMGGTIATTIASEEGARALAPIGLLFMFIGVGFMMFIALLSLPYTVIVSAAGPHVITKGSFTAGFEFREWWQVLRKGVGQFILAYAIVLVVSFVFAAVMQIAALTIVLMCVVPFVMIPYTAYLLLITNALYAQAYATGRDALQSE
jgi:hypothetical protein